MNQQRSIRLWEGGLAAIDEQGNVLALVCRGHGEGDWMFKPIVAGDYTDMTYVPLVHALDTLLRFSGAR